MWSFIRLAARLALALPWTFACLFYFELRAFFSPKKTLALRDQYLRLWGRGILKLFAFRYRFILPETPLSGSFLLVANHRSAMDIPVLLAVFGGVLLSHHGVIAWPLFGFCARRVGTVFVNREDRHSGAKAIRAIKKRLDAGNTVIIFPEGTTFEGDEVRPFHTGALSAAKLSGVHILPVGICYDEGIAFTDRSFASYLKRIGRKKELAVTVNVGTPLEMTAPTTEIKARVHGEIQNLVHHARSIHSEVSGV
ncbi:MAG: 1-acyl-sn-glycerol-3-phosphate acyltransferase [Myxococcales bacterium]|nr:MAG: 1-acyl-sn-glycerol-3-phosphate acyltransferase [Myxococcales bacterium]